MSFYLQEPATTAPLTDALDRASAHALSGGGVFAFATADGIDTLLSLGGVSSMLRRRRTFKLVVGLDAITNGNALLTLEESSRRWRSLWVRAFLHRESGIFHPKFCWFQHEDHLCVVTGSGNLTNRGLGADKSPNWEAYSIQKLFGDANEAFASKIDDWLHREGHTRLVQVDSRDARDRAMANAWVRSSSTAKPKSAPVPKKTQPLTATAAPQTVAAPSEVLLRELSKNRPGQADIGRDALRFFGFTGSPVKVLTQYVGLDDKLATTVERDLFVNASDNYRFELGPIARDDSRPDEHGNRAILVAVQLDDRSYRYTVVPPSHADHHLLVDLLAPAKTARSMRMAFHEAEDVKRAWPSAPKNLFPATSVLDVESLFA